MSAPRKVLLVGWDAADWKVASPLMDRGEMPMLAKLVSTGVMGNLATLEPVLSPLLWTSVATGKRAYDHGVTNFTDVDPVSGQVRPVTSASRRCKAVWEILAERGLSSHVVGWFATHGERIPGGGVVSDSFARASSRSAATRAKRLWNCALPSWDARQTSARGWETRSDRCRS